MAQPVYFDRVWESTIVTSTGAATLLGAVNSPLYRTFAAAGVVNGDKVPYVISHRTATELEIGLGTWGTGGVLTRTTVVFSTNANAAVNFSAGTKDVLLYDPAGKASLPRVTLFTATDGTAHTWSDLATDVYMLGYGPGGGGGSGRRGAASTARGGGAAGGGGAMDEMRAKIASLVATVWVVAPAGGPGGTAVTTNTTSGNPGGSASAITGVYNSPIDSSGTNLLWCGVGSGGAGGTTVVTDTGADGGLGLINGSNGGNGGVSGSTAGVTSRGAPSGGGGGGGYTSTNVVIDGKDGGLVYAGGARQTIISISTGFAGTDSTSPLNHAPGGGGSGGNVGNTLGTIAGGRGGNGVRGGGGGGGGASTNGANSGAGGSGGDGWVVLIET